MPGGSERGHIRTFVFRSRLAQSGHARRLDSAHPAVDMPRNGISRLSPRRRAQGQGEARLSRTEESSEERRASQMTRSSLVFRTQMHIICVQ